MKQSQGRIEPLTRRGGLGLFVKEKICEDNIVTAENSWQAWD
jgi:hypothetical protein